MKIVSRAQQWLRRRPLKYGVETASPLERFSDRVSSLSVTPIVSLTSCAATRLLGVGLIGSLGMATAGLVAGAALGAISGQLIQHGLNNALGIGDPLGADSPGAFSKKLITGAAAGLIGSLAGTLGAAPAAVAVGALGVSALAITGRALLDRMGA